MNNYIITCSSTCDLNIEYLKKHNNNYVSFNFYLNDKKYKDDFYSNISIQDFYNDISTEDVKTSQPSPDDYVEMWTNLLKNNFDILHLELSSGISGAYNSANIAKEILKEHFPDNKILVVDTLCASGGYGYLLNLANKKKQEGYNIDDLYEYLINNRLNINHIFFTTNLDQLIKGGRISKTAGAIGKLLNIIPLMHINTEGKIEVIKKIRGYNNTLIEIIELMKKNLSISYNGNFMLGSALSDDLCQFLIDKIKNIYKNANFDETYIYNIGSVIGAHTGARTVGLYYFGDKRI